MAGWLERVKGLLRKREIREEQYKLSFDTVAAHIDLLVQDDVGSTLDEATCFAQLRTLLLEQASCKQWERIVQLLVKWPPDTLAIAYDYVKQHLTYEPAHFLEAASRGNDDGVLLRFVRDLDTLSFVHHFIQKKLGCKLKQVERPGWGESWYRFVYQDAYLDLYENPYPSAPSASLFTFKEGAHLHNRRERPRAIQACAQRIVDGYLMTYSPLEYELMAGLRRRHERHTQLLSA